MTLAGDRTSRLLSVVALLGSLSLDVHADVIQLTSPPPLLNSARVTTVTYTSTQDLLPSPLVLTVPDNTLTLTLAIGDWRRAAQGQNIFGNFAFGTQLLYTNNNNFLAFDGVTTVGGGGSGPVEIEFASPVDLFWLRAQNGVIGPEMFTFSVFDGETLLGTFSVGGVSGQESNEALTAPIGARATQGACVTRVVISSQSFGSGQVLENDFYFGPISFRTIRGQRCEARPGPSAVRSIAQPDSYVACAPASDEVIFLPPTKGHRAEETDHRRNVARRRGHPQVSRRRSDLGGVIAPGDALED